MDFNYILQNFEAMFMFITTLQHFSVLLKYLGYKWTFLDQVFYKPVQSCNRQFKILYIYH